MITYSNINKRKIVRESGPDSICDNEAKLLLDRYTESKQRSDLDKIIKLSTIHSGAASLCFDTLVEAAISDREVMDTLTESIIPWVTRSSEGYSDYNEVYKALRMNEKADNIIRNHEMIEEKFDLEQFFFTNRRYDSTCLAEITADVLNQFGNLPIRGRAQIALQEFFYLANKMGIKYSDKLVTEAIVNTIVAANPNNPDTLYNIDNTIKNNGVIDTSTAEPEEVITIRDINNYANSLNDNFADKLRHIDQIYYKIRNSCHGEEFKEDCKNAMAFLTSKISELLKTCGLDGTITIDDLRYVQKMVDDAIEKQIFMANKVQFYAPNVVKNFTFLLTLLRSLKSNIEYSIGSLYSKENINAMNEAIKWDKIFKRENLIHALSVADKRLKEKFKDINKKLTDKVTKTKDWIFDRNTAVEEAVLADGSIDYTIETWFTDDEFIPAVAQEAENLCRNINNTDLYNTDYKMYYTKIVGMVEFHMISSEVSPITESYNTDYIPASLNSYIESLLEYDYFFEDLKVPDEDDITDFLKDNPDYTSSVLQLADYAGYDKDSMENVLVRTAAYRDNDIDADACKVMNDYNSTPISDFYTNMEAVHMLSAIVFSEDYIDDDEDDDLLSDFDFDEEEYIEEKEMVKITKHPDPKKLPKNDNTNTMKNTVQKNLSSKNDNDDGISDETKTREKDKLISGINNIKLTLMGFKKKIKDLDAKAQQAARNSDTNFNMFVNNVKKMLVSDRREAIIKGSVIPSFHRCILASIGLAGLAIINPIFAVIALIGGIGVSKSLTKKERALLMDDITVELEVLEKEISNAESRGQMKKLRALLKTKKELQRQYQRIKYNIRIGKDIIPDSSTGLPNNND